MSFELTDDEWALLAHVPEQDLVEMAVDLDILVPREIDRRALIAQSLEKILERAREEGLPFSKYDRMDLEDLPPEHLAAIARLQGLSADAGVDAVLRAGQKVYKVYTKQRPDNAVALMLPSLLTALARLAAERDAMLDELSDLAGDRGGS